jgi:hypothetical protein
MNLDWLAVVLRIVEIPVVGTGHQAALAWNCGNGEGGIRTLGRAFGPTATSPHPATALSTAIRNNNLVTGDGEYKSG